MRKVVPFQKIHYEWLEHRWPSSDGLKTHMPSEVLAQLEQQNSWTGTLNGVPFICAGTMYQWPGRHCAWAYLGENTAPHMMWITRQVLLGLEKVKGRIEFEIGRAHV